MYFWGNFSGMNTTHSWTGLVKQMSSLKAVINSDFFFYINGPPAGLCNNVLVCAAHEHIIKDLPVK